MQTVPGERLWPHLPAVFRSRDDTDDLARLLGVLESLLFTGSDGVAGTPGLPGLEQRVLDLPALFAPLGGATCHGGATRTPDAFVHWLAAWLSFTPHALFAPERLRRIVGGLVPLHGLRGTRAHLLELLKLCFCDELAAIELDDRPRVGFTVGGSRIGIDTRLALSRAFWFKVVIDIDDASPAARTPNARAALERQVRAVIDFAKPAHTTYDLQWRRRGRVDTPEGAGTARA